MFWFILGILVFIIGTIIAIVCFANDESANGGITIGVTVVVSVILIILSLFGTVPTGHTGVVTTFGRVEDHTLEAGIVTKAPWQRVITMDNRVQKATVPLSCFSSDIQEVSITYTVNYQIDKANAMTIYKTIGKSYYDSVIAPNVAEAVKVVTARYTAEDLVGARDALSVAIEEVLAEKLAVYNIQITSTSIEDMDFTDVFTNAVEAKQVAQQNKLKAQTEAEQKVIEAEAAAERSKIEAEAAAQVSKIQAQADLEVTKIQADAAEYAGQKEAAKNKAIAEWITPELVEYYYIQQWNGELPTYVGGEGSTIPVLDFTK
jgi:regulator of protease activity HflC (stomatin/prohibitin superfamily)